LGVILFLVNHIVYGETSFFVGNHISKPCRLRTDPSRVKSGSCRAQIKMNDLYRVGPKFQKWSKRAATQNFFILSESPGNSETFGTKKNIG